MATRMGAFLSIRPLSTSGPSPVCFFAFPGLEKASCRPRRGLPVFGSAFPIWHLPQFFLDRKLGFSYAGNSALEH